MKLTPRSQGLRVTRPNWPKDNYLDIRRVGKGFQKICMAINERGYLITFTTDENDTDWVLVGATVHRMAEMWRNKKKSEEQLKTS